MAAMVCGPHEACATEATHALVEAYWHRGLVSAGIQPSSEIVHVRPASVASGRPFVGNTDVDGRLAGTRDWDSDADSFEGSSDDDAASVGTYVAADDEEAEAEGQQAAYDQRDGCNVPVPLQAGMVTLSGDALSKWDALVHLTAIKVWNCRLQRVWLVWLW